MGPPHFQCRRHIWQSDFLHFGPQIFEYCQKILKIIISSFLQVFEDEAKTWTGFLSAFPYSLAIGVKLLAGPLSDWAGSRMSEKARVILFTSISQAIPLSSIPPNLFIFQFVMAVLFLTISLLPNSHKIPLLCCYTAVTPFAGLWQVGAVKCAQLVGKGQQKEWGNEFKNNSGSQTFFLLNFFVEHFHQLRHCFVNKMRFFFSI